MSPALHCVLRNHVLNLVSRVEVVNHSENSQEYLTFRQRQRTSTWKISNQSIISILTLQIHAGQTLPRTTRNNVMAVDDVRCQLLAFDL